MAEIIDRQHKKYHPSATALGNCCEVNYMLLQKLLPDNAQPQQSLVFKTCSASRYRLTLDEQSRYTQVVTMQQLTASLPEYLRPSMQIRVYHDARVAEVIKSSNLKRIQAKYEYPNANMAQPDEKMQLNIFLGEWLKFCLEQGMAEASPIALSPNE